MNNLPHVPPGFRFHPTDEELVDYYLRKKIASIKIDLDVIRDVDLYKIEPWDLQEQCRIGTEEQSDWYFFSHKDKKYPTGTRTNRATTAGFWKATGRDKPIYSKNSLVGMRKTLVFYKGRAPNGQKSDWIMHEYRLETNENAPPQEEGWVVCRVFRKRLTTVARASEHDPSYWYDEHASLIPDLDSPIQMGHQRQMPYHHLLEQQQQQQPQPQQQQQQQPQPQQQPSLYSCKPELEVQYHLPHDAFLQLPQLESPKLPHYVTHGSTSLQASAMAPEQEEQADSSSQFQFMAYGKSVNPGQSVVRQVTDWRVLDKFVASQLSHDDVPKEVDHSNSAVAFQASDKQDAAFE